jgi:hypothetical protein
LLPSNCSWNPVYYWGKLISPRSFEWFDCSTTTNAATRKWIVQLDSMHQIGAKTTLQGIVIVVETGGTPKEERIKTGGIFRPHNLEFGNVLACSSSTMTSMHKQRLQEGLTLIH